MHQVTIEYFRLAMKSTESRSLGQTLHSFNKWPQQLIPSHGSIVDHHMVPFCKVIQATLGLYFIHTCLERPASGNPYGIIAFHSDEYQFLPVRLSEVLDVVPPPDVAHDAYPLRTLRHRVPTKDPVVLFPLLVTPADHLLAIALLVRAVTQQFTQIQFVLLRPEAFDGLRDPDNLTGLVAESGGGKLGNQMESKLWSGNSLCGQYLSQVVLARLAFAAEQQDASQVRHCN